MTDRAEVPDGPGYELEQVIARLAAALPELSDATCARIHESLDAYAEIDEERLAAAVERNMRTSLEALHTGVVPEPQALGGAARTAAERFASGVRVEEIVRAFRISIALIHERFVDLSIQLDLPTEEVVRGSRLMWGVGDAFTTRIITEYHALEVAATLRDAQHREGLVRALLAGTASPEAMALLDPHWRYAVVRCDLAGTDRPEVLRRLVEASGSHGSHPALVVLELDACVGIVAQRPRQVGVPAGLGPFVRPSELAGSDRVARECLSLARHLGLVGLQSPAELGWRLAAASRPDVWRDYHDRYLAPLTALGDFGDEVLRAVHVWLRCSGSVGRAARELSMHVNTVRYRLSRFEELSGADLDRQEDRVAVWWALELGDPRTFSL